MAVDDNVFRFLWAHPHDTGFISKFVNYFIDFPLLRPFNVSRQTRARDGLQLPNG
jgi:hypothetical protein